MKKYYAYGNLAGMEVCYEFSFSDTIRNFGRWLKNADGPVEGLIKIPEEDIQYFSSKFSLPFDSYAEYSFSVFKTCDFLMDHGRIVLHSVAFVLDGKAYLISGRSTVDKSTQYRNLREIYGDRISIINGDKPILRFTEKEIEVCPSPWRGKEGFGSDDLKAPLGGIIMLRQGPENVMTRCPEKESVKFLMQRILSSYDDAASLRNAASYTEAIVRSVPVWKLVNRGDLESSEMIYDAIMENKRNDG